jgi:hypothetical protein
MAKPADQSSAMGAAEDRRTEALDRHHPSGAPRITGHADGRPEVGVSDDPLESALADLIEAVLQSGADGQTLSTRLSGLRRALASGESVTETLAGESEPGTVQLLSRLLTRLMEASGNARRELARGMRAEGTSIPAIARVFGVTHQRVSNILNSTGAPTRSPAPPAAGADGYDAEDADGA